MSENCLPLWQQPLRSLPTAARVARMLTGTLPVLFLFCYLGVVACGARFFSFFSFFICICQKKCILLRRILKERAKSMCVIEQTATTTTVRLSKRRWAHLMELDKIYRLARTIKRSMQQVEYAPAMSADEAIAALRAL